MKNLLIIGIFFLNLIAYNCSDSCYDIVKSLAIKDRCLSSRGELKREMALKANDLKDFISLTRNQTCTGISFQSQTTTEWASEIFEGIERQYYDYPNSTSQNVNFTPYKSYIGEEIVNLFSGNGASDSRILYHLRHVGSHNHSWLIEQLAKKNGYRIYQSDEQAYTLNAWLSTNTTGFYNTSSEGEIFMWTNNLASKVDNFIKIVSGGNASLANPVNISLPYKNMTPYFVFVQDYNESQVMSNFELAWNLYGKGQVLNWSTFSKYLNSLSEVTKFYYENENTNTTYPLEIWNNWTSLFGTPDQLYYPNLTTNNITNVIPPPALTYNFEIKYFLLPEDLNCLINNIFMNYLTTSSSFLQMNFLTIITIMLISLLL